MTDCEALFDQIATCRRDSNDAQTELNRLEQVLIGVRSDMTLADDMLRELAEQVSAIDTEIAAVKDEARRRQIADIDERLRALDERIAEVQLALSGSGDTPPATGEEALTLAAELRELEAAATALRDERALLANGAIQPRLNSEEQAAVDRKEAERIEVDALKAEVQRFREELDQAVADTERAKDIQFDIRDGAAARQVELEEEALELGCDLARRVAVADA